MRRLAGSLLVLAVAAGCAPDVPQRGQQPPLATLTLQKSSGEIRVDGVEIGRLEQAGDRTTLRAGSPLAHFARGESPLHADAAYPRIVSFEGRLSSGEGVRQTYTLLAPPSPLSVEGFGLEVASDEPGLNSREHAALRDWLAERGLPGDSAPFEALHREDAGRELHVWYEISGRRVNGSLVALGAGDAALAHFDSLFRTEDGALKIHHKRPGENGRFTYHRRSLEQVDAIAESGGLGRRLEAHQCGCYGYGIAADIVTLGSSLYRVEADWLDDRVAAEFFLGLQRRAGFPWIGFGDRRRMRDLARRVKAYLLKDADGEQFAEVALDLPPDPPSPGLGAITYHVDLWREGRRAPLARIGHREGAIEILLFGAEGQDETWPARLETLDTLLAAMPTQVMRGDGVRDSQLAEVEQLIDLVRLLRAPDAAHLADVVSDIDAGSALDKVTRLLSSDAARFHVEADALPPAPARASERMGAL